ncbi:hypothetical protein BVC80_1289g57 [Macleaya cordata]|uniref:Uncharacterized protein n=1 Tax=Macleaya cordata TaxID=56857 RepID=A0A200Q9H6_MACCD|nr:hypothetical protein BVC80_1289g57 [Macleaya cordata]
MEGPRHFVKPCWTNFTFEAGYHISPRRTTLSAMEFAGNESNLNKGTANQKIEFISAATTGTNFDDAWMGRWPLEDITNYFNSLMLVNEAGPNWINMGSSSSKENSGGNSVQRVGAGVIKSESKINLNDNKRDVLRKGFR